MNAKTIMQNWRARKISNDTAKHDLIMSRDPGLVRAWAAIDFVIEKEQALESQNTLRERLRQLEKCLGQFVDAEQFLEFLQQFREAETQTKFRFRSLLFVGESCSGKSQRAAGFWGMHRSLLVNCQGLKESLPSLRQFSKKDYSCIIFDEVSERQVLSNKLVFQSGPKPVTLGQSPCGAHQYMRDLYAVPMILCSNEFKLTVDDGLSPEEAEWLQKNIIVAKLPKGAKAWFK